MSYTLVLIVYFDLSYIRAVFLQEFGNFVLKGFIVLHIYRLVPFSAARVVVVLL
jgi:hypothetical protein